jgi:CPA2 family monovalent cation:H+ antiporter-2
VLQVFLNVALIRAVFITAAFFARTQPAWLPAMLQDDAAFKSALWITAVLVALPLFIAAFRKLQALGLLIADLKVREASAGVRTEAIRSIVSQGIPLGGLFGLFMLGLSLSAPLLPPLRIFIVLLVLAGLLTFLLWRSAIKIYAKAQYALHETLNQTPMERPVAAPAPLPNLLRNADLQVITLAAGTIAIGKLIRETGLRKETGASIVGIDRNGTSIINPEADEELRAGDQILLLGTTAQLEAAQKFLARPSIAG